jgi:hypothetical protein
MMPLPERIFPDVYEPPPRENLSTINDYRTVRRERPLGSETSTSGRT